MTDLYYNTTGLTGDELAERRAAAKTQEEKIALFFRVNPLGRFTPFDIQKGVPGFERVPITSIRRGLTNLTKSGVLVKSDEYRQGAYGQKNHCWQLSPEQRGRVISDFSIPNVTGGYTPNTLTDLQITTNNLFYALKSLRKSE